MLRKIMDADIADRWKSTICEFAKENNIEIGASFWNVGNLKKRYPRQFHFMEAVVQLLKVVRKKKHDMIP